MKKIFLTIMVTLLVLFSGLFVTSCAFVDDGQGGKVIRLTPQVHKTIGDMGKGTTDILGILSMFMPVLSPIAAAAGAGTLTWNRMGKKVTKYKTPLEHTVIMLEHIKKDKELWALVKPYLKGDGLADKAKPSAETKATIMEVIDKTNGAA